MSCTSPHIEDEAEVVVKVVGEDEARQPNNSNHNSNNSMISNLKVTIPVGSVATLTTGTRNAQQSIPHVKAVVRKATINPSAGTRPGKTKSNKRDKQDTKNSTTWVNFP